MTTSIVTRGLDQLGALPVLSRSRTSDERRCAEWTVADLSDHIVNSTAGMATMARGGEPN